jgi:uncharacterized metal-binding protein
MPSEIQPGLIAAYEATEFRVIGAFPFTLRIGIFSPELDAVFQRWGGIPQLSSPLGTHVAKHMPLTPTPPCRQISSKPSQQWAFIRFLGSPRQGEACRL